MAKKKEFPSILTLDFGGLIEQRNTTRAMAVAYAIKFHIPKVDYIQMLYVGRADCPYSGDSLCMEVRKRYIFLAVCKNGESQSLAVFPTKLYATRKLGQDIEKFFRRSFKNGTKIRKGICGMCADIGMPTVLSNDFVAPVPLTIGEIKIYKLLAAIENENPTIKVKSPRKYIMSKNKNVWSLKSWRSLIDKGVAEAQEDGSFLIHRIEYTAIRNKKKRVGAPATTKKDTSLRKKVDNSATERRKNDMRQNPTETVFVTRVEWRAYETLLNEMHPGANQTKCVGPRQTLKENDINPMILNHLVAKGLAADTGEKAGRSPIFLLYRKAVAIEYRAATPTKTQSTPNRLPEGEMPQEVTLAPIEASLYELLLSYGNDQEDHFYLDDHCDRLNNEPGKRKNWYSVTLRRLKALKIVSGTRGGIHVYRLKYNVKAKTIRKAKKKRPGNGQGMPELSLKQLAKEVASKLRTPADYGNFLTALGREIKNLSNEQLANNEADIPNITTQVTN